MLGVSPNRRFEVRLPSSVRTLGALGGQGGQGWAKALDRPLAHRLSRPSTSLSGRVAAIAPVALPERPATRPLSATRPRPPRRLGLPDEPRPQRPGSATT